MSKCWLNCLENSKHSFIARGHRGCRLQQDAGGKLLHLDENLLLPKCVFTKPWELAAHGCLTITLTIWANSAICTHVSTGNWTSHPWSTIQTFIFVTCRVDTFLRWHKMFLARAMSRDCFVSLRVLMQWCRDEWILGADDFFRFSTQLYFYADWSKTLWKVLRRKFSVKKLLQFQNPNCSLRALQDLVWPHPPTGVSLWVNGWMKGHCKKLCRTMKGWKVLFEGTHLVSTHMAL